LKAIIIAIDGYSSCGKSTLAKALAQKLGYGYIDTGAMYRAVTLYFLRHHINLQDTEAIEQALRNIQIRFAATPEGNATFLNGENVETEIRQMPVSQKVSEVAAISAVRRVMVQQQQEMGKEKGIVMDGRDIGTVVFPDAELKLFVTADPMVRAQRRYDELIAKGQSVDFETIKQNLQERDRIDSTRADSPLRQAEDAIVIDNTNLTREEQLERAVKLVNKSDRSD
jgi:cytidylate kinase